MSNRTEELERLQEATYSDSDPLAGEKVYESIFDPENAPTQQHNWVDRGLKMSCEGAGHPYHQSMKRRVHKQPKGGPR